MADPLQQGGEAVDCSKMPPAPGYRTPLSVMTWKVPTEYIQQNNEFDDEEDFWSDPVGEAEALDKIGLTTEPKVSEHSGIMLANLPPQHLGCQV